MSSHSFNLLKPRWVVHGLALTLDEVRKNKAPRRHHQYTLLLRTKRWVEALADRTAAAWRARR